MFSRAFLLLVTLTVVMVAVWSWRELHQPVRADAGNLLVVVQSGETPGHVLHRLQTEARIRYSLPLKVWLRLQPATGMQAGEYEIPAGTKAVDLIASLLSGRTAQRPFTIIEGWSIRQLRDALRAESRLLQKTEGLSDGELMAALDNAGLHPEGRFAPDTYFFSPYSSSDLDVLRRAFGAQQTRLQAVWSQRADGLPYADSGQLLVMASIIEKETGQADERPDIAGVFVRRMKIGMRLQTDPTVIYGLGEDYAGNITRAHLQRPSPYNTYIIDGLPPTPIAMPGLAALEAAAHPAEGNALYFVGRGDGSHQFSATLEAHNAAVREYQLRRRDDYRSAPQR